MRKHYTKFQPSRSKCLEIIPYLKLETTDDTTYIRHPSLKNSWRGQWKMNTCTISNSVGYLLPLAFSYILQIVYLLVGDLKNAPEPDFLLREESRRPFFSLKFLLLTPGMPIPPPIPNVFLVASDFCKSSALNWLRYISNLYFLFLSLGRNRGATSGATGSSAGTKNSSFSVVNRHQ